MEVVAAAAATMAISVEEENRNRARSVNEWGKSDKRRRFNGSGPVVGR